MLDKDEFFKLLKYFEVAQLGSNSAGVPAADFNNVPIIQHVITQDATRVTGSTQIPYDNSIPTSSEGVAYAQLDTTITPTNSSNDLIITVNVFLVHSVGHAAVTVALFKDAGVAAIAAGSGVIPSNSVGSMVTIVHKINAGSTSAQTFKVRFGRNNTGTSSVNGSSSDVYYGGVGFSTMEIKEISV